MKGKRSIPVVVFALLAMRLGGFAQHTAGPAPGIQGVQGVNQRAAASVKGLEPTMAKPVVPPPPVAVAAEAKNGVAPPPRSQVKGVAPAPAAQATGAIRAVKGVQGIQVPKQRNLEAALRIKDGAKDSGREVKAAAAALFRSQAKEKGTNPMEDDRKVFEEFAKQILPGS